MMQELIDFADSLYQHVDDETPDDEKQTKESQENNIPEEVTTKIPQVEETSEEQNWRQRTH